jgi:hypothetical protein
VMAGDINMIYSAEDKNNANLNIMSMGSFRRMMNDLELKEIPLLGRRYTWSNEREHQPSSSWIEFFAWQIGKLCTQKLSFRVKPWRSLTTAHSSSVSRKKFKVKKVPF